MTRLYVPAYKITIITYFINVNVKHFINLLAYRTALLWRRRGISITSQVRDKIHGKVKILVSLTLTVKTSIYPYLYICDCF
jgi:hypothetical protein